MPLSYYAQEPVTAAELFSRLIERHRSQEALLERFSVSRTYRLQDDKGKKLAEEKVVMEYRAPGTKTFRVTSANGSAFIRGHVFQRLMKLEANRARGTKNQDSSITPENYTLEIVARERLGSSDCVVVHAIPKHKEAYLFDGKLWIDDQDFAIVKVTGRLAKSPSFWIKRVDFVREYEKIDVFWLPLREELTADVRIYGRKILTIDYRHYNVNTARIVHALLTNSPSQKEYAFLHPLTCHCLLPRRHRKAVD